MMFLTSISQAPDSGGVYAVTNLLNSKVYIGQSSNIRARLRQHRKVTTQSALSNDIKIYGAVNFSWKVLHESDSLSERHALECFWIAKTDSTKLGYNKATGGPGPTGFKMANETKEKLSLALTGRHVSEETKEKHRVAATGFKHSQETRDLLSKRRTGVPLSAEIAAKMSESRKGALNPKARRVKLTLPGATLEFGTVTELASAIGISRLTIANWLKSGLPVGILKVVDGAVVRTANKMPNSKRDTAALAYLD